MNQDIKIKLLYIVIAILLLLNVTLFFSLYVNKTEKKEVQTFGKMSDEIPKDYKTHFFTYYLKLDSLQIIQLKEINTKYLSSKKALSKAVGVLTMELANKINSGCSRNEEIVYYDSLIQLHTKMKYENYIYYVNLRKMCNTEQQHMLDKFFSSILCIDQSLCSNIEFINNQPQIKLK